MNPPSIGSGLSSDDNTATNPAQAQSAANAHSNHLVAPVKASPAESPNEGHGKQNQRQIFGKSHALTRSPDSNRLFVFVSAPSDRFDTRRGYIDRGADDRSSHFDRCGDHRYGGVSDGYDGAPRAENG